LKPITEYIVKVFLFFLLHSALYAKCDTLITPLDIINNNYFEETSETDQDSRLYDYLEGKKHEQHEINEAGFFDLMSVPFMDISTANSIMLYRKNSGHIFSFAELYNIPGIDSSAVNNIIPFITIDYRYADNNNLPETGIEFRSRFVQDLQERAGFINHHFAGNKAKLYQRARIKFNKRFVFGYTAEKDPGETSLTDFSSFYCSLINIEPVKQMILGDYTLDYGQGLALGGTTPSYISGNTFNGIAKTGNGISPYSGSYENKFFRGIASQFLYKGVGLDLFYSEKKFDAVLDTASGEISSIPLSGFHRTETEIKEKQLASVTTKGASFRYTSDFFSSGILYCSYSFGNPLVADISFEQNKKDFSVASVYYTINYNSIFFSGEAATAGGNTAFVNTLYATLHETVSFIFSLRNYSRNYFSFFANGYGAGSTNDESGIYFGSRIKTEIGVFDLHFDSYKHSQTRSYELPQNRKEFVINYTGKRFAPFGYSIRYINQSVETGNSAFSDIQTKQRVRLRIEDVKSGYFCFNTSVNYCKYKLENSGINESGFAITQEALYAGLGNVVINGGLTFYSTDSYNSAISIYEKDLPGTLSNTALYKTGEKYYLLLQYLPATFIKLSLKYSENFKPKEAFISSGDNLIPGNIDNRIAFQIDMKL